MKVFTYAEDSRNIIFRKGDTELSVALRKTKQFFLSLTNPHTYTYKNYLKAK